MLRFLMVIFTYVLCLNAAQATANFPEGFVYLEEVDPTIIQNLRYYSKENFIGKRLDGYKANRVILTRPTALALKRAQDILLKDGYSLVVYDAYRPQKAVDAIIKWSNNFKDQKYKEDYYPRTDKSRITNFGYFALKSPHSRGSAVDVTIISLNKTPGPIIKTHRKLTNNVSMTFLDDGTVDMGTSFDLMDEASAPGSKLVLDKNRSKRAYLREVMTTVGFKPDEREWWHFLLENEMYPDTYFDFDIE
ncbi:MAG: M15 family metallopeptidase [Sphingobacteriia bacterium]|nr:M15 family metallopeptidase [Sphingobacteriia bacterium]